MIPPPATISGRSAGRQQIQRLLDLRPAGGRLVDRKRLVGGRIEFDLGHLHVHRQVDQHRARSAGTHQVERLLEGAGHLCGLQHGHRHLGQRLRDGGDVDGLEVLLVQPGDRSLPGDAQDRDRVGGCRVQPGDHVGAGRAGRADAHPDVAGGGAGVSLGHVRGTLDVAGQGVGDLALVAHRAVHRIDGGSGQPEDVGDALQAENLHRCAGCGHTWHGSWPFGSDQK